jgi:hypothetical protein
MCGSSGNGVSEMTTTWRELCDELTAEQITELEYDESFGDCTDDGLLFQARDHAAMNLEALL